MKNTANLSRDRRYRYTLWRTWGDSKPYVLFIGLNPSSADVNMDNPTLVRCMKYAKSWGYGGVCLANLFAYRATQPEDMKAAESPIGSQNNRWLKQLSKDAGLIVGAWGNDGAHLNRSQQVRKMLPEMHCLKMNKSGEPAHPLYQRADVKPTLMPPITS